MKTKFLLVLVLPLLLSATVHKYYLSVTDVNYNEEAAAVQVITRLFYDDLEDVLQERYRADIKVDATADQELLDTYLSKYLSQKLVITVNGDDIPLNFLGKKYEDDFVVCFLEATDIESIKNFSVENTLLMDLFPDQKNMIHTTINGKKKSFLLIDGNTKGLLNFSE